MTLEYLRSFRVAGYAIFDLGISFLGIYLLSPLLTNLFLKIKIKIPRENWLFLTLPISIAVHLLVGRITQMTADFISPSDHYLLKLFILILFFFGLKNIKRI